MRRLFYLVCCATLALAACGGSDDPPANGGTPPPGGGPLTASITPDTGLALAPSAEVVVTFSAPVNKASLQLSGTFLALAPASRWSADGDTLTLAPPAGGWPRGQGGTLAVLARSAAGAEMTGPATATYLVPLQLASGQPALGAIGQADLSTSNAQAANGRSERTLFGLFGGVAVAPGGRLFVADGANHRILGFPAVPTASDAGADLVLGQPDFTSAIAGTTQGTLTRPQQVSIAGGRMAVVDYSNHRVLLWPTVPTASGALPDVAVGQPGFVTGGSSCSATGLNFAETVVLTPDGKMLVADTENHRVLVWLTVPTASGTPADLVLGQSMFTQCRANDDDQNNTRDPAPTARTLYRPTGVWSDGQRVVVVDSWNHRVLVWNTFPTANFQPASVVLGQSAFTRFAANDDNQDGAADGTPTARTLRDPWDGVHSNGVQLAVSDSGNNRVLVWNTFPTSNFQPADAVLGQADFTGAAAATAADRMSYPVGVLFHQDKLLVTDRNNHRVLVLRSP